MSEESDGLRESFDEVREVFFAAREQKNTSGRKAPGSPARRRRTRAAAQGVKNLWPWGRGLGCT